jgi:hypothetical protein
MQVQSDRVFQSANEAHFGVGLFDFHALIIQVVCLVLQRKVDFLPTDRPRALESG